MFPSSVFEIVKNAILSELGELEIVDWLNTCSPMGSFIERYLSGGTIWFLSLISSEKLLANAILFKGFGYRERLLNLFPI